MSTLSKKLEKFQSTAKTGDTVPLRVWKWYAKSGESAGDPSGQTLSGCQLPSTHSPKDGCLKEQSHNTEVDQVKGYAQGWLFKETVSQHGGRPSKRLRPRMVV